MTPSRFSCHSRRRRCTLGALLGAGVVLAACSSGGSSSSTTSSSPATTRATTTTTTSAASTTTTTAGLARCATTALIGSVAGSGGAAGTIETTIGLKSTATGSCSLGGFPGLQLLDASGTNLPTNVVRTGNYSFTAMAPTTVTLVPGQTAYFNIGYSDVPVGTETSCPTSTSLLVTPPNATDSLRMTAMLAPCGGGTMVVSPVFVPTTSNSQTMAPSTG